MSRVSNRRGYEATRMPGYFCRLVLFSHVLKKWMQQLALRSSTALQAWANATTYPHEERAPDCRGSKPAVLRPASTPTSKSVKSLIPQEPVTLMEPTMLQAGLQVQPVRAPAPPWTLQMPASPSSRLSYPSHPSPYSLAPTASTASTASAASASAEPAEPAEPAESKPAPTPLWPEGGGKIRLPCKAPSWIFSPSPSLSLSLPLFLFSLSLSFSLSFSPFPSLPPYTLIGTIVV